jgi:predicted nucleic acid-binding protein
MTALILDAGAFISIEKNDRSMIALLKAARPSYFSLRSNGSVIAEVWRGGSGSHVTLARLLAAVELLPVDGDVGRAAGALIHDAGGGSAIDATVVAIARDGDQIVTSDRRDIQVLVNVSGRDLKVIPC